MTGPRVVTEQTWMAEGLCRGMPSDDEWDRAELGALLMVTFGLPRVSVAEAIIEHRARLDAQGRLFEVAS